MQAYLKEKNIFLYPTTMLHIIIFVHLVLFRTLSLSINVEYTILFLSLIILLDIIMFFFKDMFAILLEIQYMIFILHISLHYILLGGFGSSNGFPLLYAIIPIGILSLGDIRKKTTSIKIGLYAISIFIIFIMSDIFRTYLHQFSLFVNFDNETIIEKIFFTSNLILFSVVIFIRLFFISNRNRHLENRTISIIYNVLPKNISDSVINNAQDTSTLEHFDTATLLFADIVSFTKNSAQMDINILIQRLNTLFLSFDELVEKYELEKIKTIGDAYVVGTGLHTPHDSQKLLAFAHELLEIKNNTNFFEDKPCQFTVGIYTGSLYAGILGKKYFYDVWGDSIEESEFYGYLTAPDTISISQSVLDMLPEDADISYTKIPIDEHKGTYRYQLIKK